MPSNAEPPTLTTIPPELRLQIYSYLFDPPTHSGPLPDISGIPALLHVNRLIRHEVFPLATGFVKSVVYIASHEHDQSRARYDSYLDRVAILWWEDIFNMWVEDTAMESWALWLERMKELAEIVGMEVEM